MPEASIVIVTRDRKEKARFAVESALAQEGNNEVIVMDDGSSDGTSEYLGTLFPKVKLIRNEKREGLVVLRSRSARIATSPVVFSIDDDAVFADGTVVRATLGMMTDPRIGAVAIPHANRRPDGSSQTWWPALPDPNRTYVVSKFIGTAYAVRRDVFQELGGFQDCLFHWGEETDYAQRLFGAGYLIRLGASGLILHSPEGAGKYSREVNRYILRNQILTAWFNAPLPYLLAALIWLPLRGMLGALGPDGELGTALEGIAMGFSGIWRFRRLRRPLALARYRLWLFIRRRTFVPLEEIAGLIPSPPGSLAMQF